MKKFKIPVDWSMCADVEVQANSLQEAIDIVQLQWAELPMEGEYIDSSFQVNIDCAYQMNDEQGVIKDDIH